MRRAFVLLVSILCAMFATLDICVSAYAAEHLDKCRALLSSHDYENAVQACATSVEKEGETAETLKLLGEAQYYMGKATDSLASYERAREIAPEDTEALFGASRIYCMYTHDSIFKDADKHCYEYVLQASIENPRFVNKYFSTLGMGTFDEKVRSSILETMDRINSSGAINSDEGIGYLYVKLRQCEIGLKKLKNAREPSMTKAEAYMCNELFEKAEKQYSQLIEEGFGNFSYDRAIARAGLGRCDLVEEDFIAGTNRKDFEFSNSHSFYDYVVGLCYLKTQDYPKSYKRLLAWGRIWGEDSLYYKTLDQILERMRTSGVDVEAFKNDANMEIELNSQCQSMEGCREAAKIAMKNRQFDLAKILLSKSGKFESAISPYTGLDIEQLLDEGVKSLEELDAKRALLLFTEAVEKEPGSGKAHRFKGKANLWLGNFREGRIELRKAIEIDPNDAQAHFLLGSSYGPFEDPLAAAESFMNALRLDSNLGKNIFETLLVPNNDVRYKKNLIKLLENGGQVSYGSGVMYLSRAFDLLALGRYEEAIHNATIDINKSETSYNNAFSQEYEIRGIAYAMTGKYGDALNDLDKAISLTMVSGKYYADKGIILALAGDCEGMTSILNKSLNKDAQTDAKLLYHEFLEGACYIYRNDKEDAKMALAKISENSGEWPGFKNSINLYLQNN